MIMLLRGPKVSEERQGRIDLREQVQGVSQSPAQSPLESVRMVQEQRMAWGDIDLTFRISGTPSWMIWITRSSFGPSSV